MLKNLKGRGFTKQNTWICFEHTGHYSMLLCSLLAADGYTFSMLPPIEVKKSLGLVRGKNDKVDAQRLAEYGATKKHKLKPSKLPAKNLLKIEQLFSLRRQLVKQWTSLTNNLKAQKGMQDVVDNDFGISTTEHLITTLKTSIQDVENQILKIIKSDKELKKSYNLLTSIKGVGTILAFVLLTHTQNFETFDDPRKFICYAGMAPFTNSSGQHTGKARTSWYRHKYLKSLFFNGSRSAIQHDPQLRKYYNDKLQEGKNKLGVLNAVSCKLVYRAFAVMRREQPYVIHGQA